MMKPYYETKLGKLYHGDCLEIMPQLEPVDLVLTDPPYGTTACSWDIVIPLEPMWEQLKRIIKKNGAVVLFGNQPFTTVLISSNMEMYKYDWIWEKIKAGNFIQAKNNPLKLHENICVFSNGVVIHKGQSTKRMPYNPIGVKDVAKKWHRPKIYDSEHNYKRPSHTTDRIINQECFPNSIIKINSIHNPPHPTQKPVELMEYLIKTYSNEEQTVLDFAIGSGTTAIACERLKRKWIGIEIEEKYCEIAAKRIEGNLTMMERIKRSEKSITKKTGLLF